MEIIREIPKEVWGKTLEIINKIIYPVTATTTGVGKLIEQKFKTLNDVQKIIAEQTLKETAEKVKKSGKTDFENVVVKPQVLYVLLENTDSQSDDFIRSLWANLGARELSEGSIHPEIARIFSKLTAADLVVLSKLHSETSTTTQLIVKALATAYTLGLFRDPKSFNHVYLTELGLIDNVSGKWLVTTKGKELMHCIGELGGGS